MFRKIVSLTALLCCALFAGCCADKSYNVALIGDVHFDHTKYHDMSKMKHLGIPQEKYVYNKDGFFSWRNHSIWTEINQGGSVEKNTPLNMNMWKKYMPVLLDSAALEAKKSSVRFTVQMGDIIHGDCYDLALNKENLQGAVKQLTNRFDKVFLVSGNHDSRGPGAAQAWDEVINTYLDGTAKNLQRKNTNYCFTVGKDLYFFYDLMNPDVDFFEQALKANPDSRYTFFISHVPLLPTSKRAVRGILTDDIYRLFNLLEARNAIVLSGHTHKVSVVRYANPANGHRIDQLILNSTVRFPKKQLKFKPTVDIPDPNFPPKVNKEKELWNKLYDGKITTLLHTDGSGYAILRVSDKGVFVDYRNLKNSNVYTWQLR